jgi:pimeloyl-ACP methyl ester carboxylesterase
MWLVLAAMTLADSTLAMRVPVAPAETLTVSVSEGHGRTVVLVPGLFGAVYGYRKVVPLLIADGYRVIVIEPLAVGQSGRPRKADYSLTAQADRIASVLDTFGVRGAVIVAHALAGSMALRLAYRHPEMVSGIVSLNGGPAEAAASPGFRRAMQFVPWVKWMGGASLLQKQIPKSLRKASGDPSWVTDDVVREYTAGATADLDGTLYAYLAMADSREPEKLAPHLADIHCPVRLMLGPAASDGVIKGDEMSRMQASLSDFAVQEIAGAGSYLQEERPDAVVEAVVLMASGLH